MSLPHPVQPLGPTPPRLPFATSAAGTRSFSTRAWVLLLALVACTPSAVPHLSAARLPRPQLRALCPRQISLQIVDERPVPLEDRLATELHLREILSTVMGSANVVVAPAAAYAFEVRVRSPSGERLGMPVGWCIELAGNIVLWKLLPLPSGAVSCSGLSSADGVLLGPTLSTSFERATDTLLHAWDDQLGGPPECWGPPRFDPAQVQVPRFSRLRARVIGLRVRDEWGDDGAAGRSLQLALEAAFARTALLVEEQATPSLTFTVRRPADALSGFPRETCVEIALEAKWETETRSARTVECRTLSGPPTHHLALNRLLSLLD